MKGFKELIKIPDYVTLASTACGLLAIFASISGEFAVAAALLLGALLFDRLDGKLARILELGEREFGKEIDSLSDTISFGAAPAVFGYTLGLKDPLAVVVLLFFVCAGLLRLARFNVAKYEAGYYQGMNIAYNGLIFPVLYFICPEAWKLNLFLTAYFISGCLMLTSLKWKKI
jgi:CDP-diacylglycerol--serine O-phosphatidyltransferase